MTGEIDSSTIGPIVTGSTECPSPTAKGKTRQHAAISASICSPSREKSEAYSEGSTSAPRIHSFQDTSAMLRTEPRDEEAARAVAVGPREQELRALRVRVLRPLVRERVDLEPARVHDRLVL